MHRIRAIARSRGIAILEDASDAVRGTFLGRRAGSLGDVSVFGFDRTETLTSAEGGVVATSCDRLAAAIKEILSEDTFDYAMSPMQAALAVAQLERIEDLIARKQQIETWYRQSLAHVPGLRFVETVSHSCRVPSEVSIALECANVPDMTQIVEEMALRGMECRAMVAPASSLPRYADLQQARVARFRNRISYSIGPRCITLPSGTNLTRREVEEVAGVLRDVVSRHRSGVLPHKRAA
jgi:perosamine synthetase